MSLRNSFSINKESTAGGRLGQLKAVRPKFANNEPSVETPYIFPVVNVIGGPPGPDRNGGLWRPIKWWMFLERQIPGFLTQVLHVLDFNIKSKDWGGWKAKPFSEWIVDWQKWDRDTYDRNYENQPSRHGRPDNRYPFRKWMELWEFWREDPGQRHKAPLTFLDSGGFTLMKRDALQKIDLWYHLDTSPKGILELQLDMGGDLVASLDYPLPPGLTDDEIEMRQDKSIENALAMLREVAVRNARAKLNESTVPPVTALPYVAVHGVDYNTALRYMERFFEGWHQLPKAARALPFGLAIGSMVPRADAARTVVEVTAGIMDGLRQAKPNLPKHLQRPPVHMFGISSHLIGFLAYLGVDTFDSQTYADVAQRCAYFDNNLRSTHFLKVSQETLRQCDCYICEKIASAGLLEKMQEHLQRRTEPGVGSKDEYYKEIHHTELQFTRSDMYSLLAMHNWNRIQKVLQDVRHAIAEDSLATYLVQLVKDQKGAAGSKKQRGNKLEQALVWIATEEQKRGASPLTDAIEREMGSIPALKPYTANKGSKSVPSVTINPNYTKADFSVPADYARPEGKDVLLVLACSKGKPYRTSAHQSKVLKRLRSEFGEDRMNRVHKVTLSGLYGPVPEEFEDEPAVTNYNFMLERGHTEQEKVVSERLQTYLNMKHGKPYQAVCIFIYFAGYREAVDRVFKPSEHAYMVPRSVNMLHSEAYYLDRLVDTLEEELGPRTPKAAATSGHPVQQTFDL